MATQEGPLYPSRDPIAAADSLLVTPRWRTWLLNLRQTVDSSAIAIPTVPAENQTAAIPTTALDTGNLSAGLYAVAWSMSVITPAGVSSSAQVTIGWVEQGITKSYTGPAMTGNTTTTVQVDQRIMIYSDGASPITYAIAYASNPANIMKYTFRPVLQSVATQ